MKTRQPGTRLDVMKFTGIFRFPLVIIVLSVFVVVVFYIGCQGEILSTDADRETDPNGSRGKNQVISAKTAPVLGNTTEGGTAEQAPGLITDLTGPYAPTPVSEYVFPMVSGSLGSSWCACRNVGSSPHIGQDVIGSAQTAQGAQTSIALSTGQVTELNYDSDCGWSVHFRDSMGSVWRYLHLNKPKVTSGQFLTRGAVIGMHSSYPTASCGTGPHLHLERRTAGRFSSAEEFRTCQFGRRTCYFNPVAPIQSARKIRSEAERIAIVQDNSARVMQTVDDRSLETASETCQKVLFGNPNFALNNVSFSNRDADTTGLLGVTLNSVAPLDFQLSVKGNPENSCSFSVLNSDRLQSSACIQSWTLSASESVLNSGGEENIDGEHYVELLSAQGVAHQAIRLSENLKLCVYSARTLLFRAVLRDGTILTKTIEL